MGVEYWIVDHDKEIKVYLGKIGHKQIFKNYVRQVKELKELLNNDIPDIKDTIWNDHYDLNDTKIQDITIEQLSFLLHCKRTVEAIPFPDRGLFAFTYFIEEIEQNNHDWDYVSDTNNTIKEYDDYTELNSPFE